MGNPVRPGLSPWQGKNPIPTTGGGYVPGIWADEIMKEFRKGFREMNQIMKEADEIAVVRKKPYT